MRCSHCSRTTVWHAPALCAAHFSARFERKIEETIRAHRLIRKDDKVAVACSGGKDSTTLLFVLKRLGYDVTALAVDEGIAGYRDKTLSDLRRFCKKNKIPLRITSFEKEYGKTLDAILKKRFRACTVCGTFRRRLLNKAARRFDVLATGHNADDESQAVLMNLARAHTALFARIGPTTTSRGMDAAAALEQDRGLSAGAAAKRQGPPSGDGRSLLRAQRAAALRGSGGRGFVRKVKPLYFVTEKETLTYALLHGLATAWNECPYAPEAYRNDARAALLAYGRQRPGARERVLRHFLTVKKRLSPGTTRAVPCASCGEPSMTGLCKACRLEAEI